MAPGLPLFSGSEPTPRDEGTYEQWKFQVKEMRSSCPESMVRSALIMLVRGEASELVGFVGFNSPLSVILEAIDKSFSKKSTVDHLQPLCVFLAFILGGNWTRGLAPQRMHNELHFVYLRHCGY